MRLPVYARFSVDSPLTAEEIEARLAPAVGPPDHADPRLAGFEFLGTVESGTFACRRFLRSWSQIVAPDLEGWIHRRENGARIEVALRPRLELLAVLLFPAFLWLRGQITPRDAHVAVPLAFGIVGVLTVASVAWEFVLARRFVRRIAGVGARHPASR